MEHRAVRGAAAAEMMPLHKSGKPTPFASSNDVDKFVPSEDVDHDLIAWICAVLALNRALPGLIDAASERYAKEE